MHDVKNNPVVVFSDPLVAAVEFVDGSDRVIGRIVDISEGSAGFLGIYSMNGGAVRHGEAAMVEFLFRGRLFKRKGIVGCRKTCGAYPIDFVIPFPLCEISAINVDLAAA